MMSNNRAGCPRFRSVPVYVRINPSFIEYTSESRLQSLVGILQVVLRVVDIIPAFSASRDRGVVYTLPRKPKRGYYKPWLASGVSPDS